MGFFRLGKIDRRQEGEKDETKSNSTAAASRTSISASAGASDSEKERPEKKKKSKDTDSAAAGAVGITGSDSSSGTSPTANSSGGAAAGSGSTRSSGGAAAAGVGSAGSAGGGTSGTATRGQVGLSVNDFISKTKNQQRQGLKPSGPELIAYARYLGIDPVADHDLLWIAVEALEAPLPSDWTEHFDSNDRVFYYNATMRVSSWTHPLEHIYRETYKTIVNFRNSNMTSHERADKLMTLQFEVKQMEQDVHKEISQWTEHADESGNRFYFNREERQSTWTDPRPAKCQILYLRMKMLRLLQSSSGGTPGFADPSKSESMSRQKMGARTGAGESSASASSADGTRTSFRDEASASSPNSPESHRDSDSDTDDEHRRKKKKKKKKKKRREHSPPADDSRHHSAAAPPPRPGAQGLGSSRSEPTVSAKPLLHGAPPIECRISSPGTADEMRGGLAGIGLPTDATCGMQTSPTGPQSLGALGAYDSHEGLSNVGRTKVKAGIRLEPIAAPAAMAPSQGGVRNSASVPLLP